jgi:hypothetical protein
MQAILEQIVTKFMLRVRFWPYRNMHALVLMENYFSRLRWIFYENRELKKLTVLECAEKNLCFFYNSPDKCHLFVVVIVAIPKRGEEEIIK